MALEGASLSSTRNYLPAQLIFLAETSITHQVAVFPAARGMIPRNIRPLGDHEIPSKINEVQALIQVRI